MPKVGVIVSQRAGGYRLRAEKRFAMAGTIVRPCKTEESLRSALSHFAKERVAAIAIFGGDGTIHRVISEACAHFDKLPPLVLLRGGTMNIVASDIGVPRRSAKSLLKKATNMVAHAESSGKSLRHSCTTRATLQIESRLGFIFGAGIAVGFLEAYYAGGKKNPRTALQLLTKAAMCATVGKELPPPLDERFEGVITTANGKAWSEESYLAVVAGTVSEFGLKMVPFWKGPFPKRGMQLLGYHASARRVAAILPLIRLGRPISPTIVRSEVTEKVVLRSFEGPVRYTHDGDLYTSKGPLVVESGPVISFLDLA